MNEASEPIRSESPIDIGDPLLKEIAERVMSSHDSVGLLIYGSYAAHTWQPSSDIDLIHICKNQEDHHFLVTVGQVVIDAYASTRQLLERSIKTDRHTNNNFVLDAFAHGRCLASEDGSTECLVTLARELWEAGPGQPGQAEQRKIAAAVQKAAVAIRHFGSKAESSREWKEIANLKLAHLFQELVHAYCRIHRLWASSIWEMLRWTSPQYQDLIAMCQKYLRSEIMEQRVVALNILAQATLSKIDVSSHFPVSFESLDARAIH